MTTHIEIERKFLVKKLPDHFAKFPHVEITQGYLAFDERGIEVRLRKIGADRLLTMKNWWDGRRLEREVKLSNDQFDELWPRRKDGACERYDTVCRTTASPLRSMFTKSMRGELQLLKSNFQTFQTKSHEPLFKSPIGLVKMSLR